MKKAGTILALAGPAYISNLAEHQRQGAIDVLNSIHATAASFNDELVASDADADLTPQGRAARGVTIAQSALAELASVEATTIKRLTDRATSIEQSMRAKVAYMPPKDAPHEQQLREVRDQLRALSATERLHVYRSSIDPLVLAAIETAPPTLSAPRQDGSRRLEAFVDASELATAQFARAEALDPASATVLREVQSLAEVYRLALNSVRKEINDAVPGGASVPVPTAA